MKHVPLHPDAAEVPYNAQPENADHISRAQFLRRSRPTEQTSVRAVSSQNAKKKYRTSKYENCMKGGTFSIPCGAAGVRPEVLTRKKEGKHHCLQR